MKEVVARFKDVDWISVGWKALWVVLILLAIKVILRLVNSASCRFEKRLTDQVAESVDGFEQKKRAETLSGLLRQAAAVGIWVLGALVVLSQVGIEVGPLVASAGILGLAVGFGAQNLVRDVISGFFIIFEDQVRVGDIAVVNGTGGLVEKITLRTIILRDLAGVVHVFPNGTITTLSNMTSGWSAYVLEMGVAYKEDVDRVVALMKDVSAELRQDEYFGRLMIQDIEVFGLDKFAASALVIKARIKTQPIRQWEVGREYNRRLKRAFDAAGVEIPFPHQSLQFGEASKPLLVRIAQD
jgi:small conductance mechanosensitive channel